MKKLADLTEAEFALKYGKHQSNILYQWTTTYDHRLPGKKIVYTLAGAAKDGPLDNREVLARGVADTQEHADGILTNLIDVYGLLPEGKTRKDFER